MSLRTGTCPSCGATAVYTKDGGLEGLAVDGKRVAARAFVCVTCGLTEQHVADPDVLQRIVARAEKLGDWQRLA